MKINPDSLDINRTSDEHLNANYISCNSHLLEGVYTRFHFRCNEFFSVWFLVNLHNFLHKSLRNDFHSECYFVLVDLTEMKPRKETYRICEYNEIMGQVFKSGLSRFYGRQPLKNYLVHSWILCLICYSNCCCGIRTTIKSVLWQRNRAVIYPCFQLKLAT